MKSRVLNLYKDWLATATPEQVAFVDAIYAECEAHYDAGGDTVVECYDPPTILAEFQSLDDVKEVCGLRVEKALNQRWGEDTDPELDLAKRFDEWEV